MKFYILKLNFHNETPDPNSPGPKIYPRANGDKISIDGYLTIAGKPRKIDFENYVDDAPIFDYFYLYSISYQKEYDWILLDAYNFAGKNSLSGRGFLVSERFKELLERFDIAKPYRFYESRLMYQSKKLVYHIFHLAQNEWKEFNAEKSSFWVDDKKLDVRISNNRELKKLIKANPNIKMKIHLNEFSDIFYFSQFGYVVSEELKKEMEVKGLLDFEFIEIENAKFTFSNTSV